ncbi:MAG: XRE family transcriptional regulator [Deltaproteobacteria bacterium]|jgi:transcriptional regulator with XRE-family HTH domain|nr:XRE family transcriptional regulator [Deltaproteobacteria bacterium]
MDQLSITIANNLKKLRKNRELSLGKLAELSGLSKALLGQIEKGNNNPTIQTIWKIAAGLKVSYTALIDAPSDENLLITRADALARSQTIPDSNCTIYCYYQTAGQRNFEVFGMRFEPGGGYVSPGHPEKSIEYLFIQEGTLKILLAGQVYILQAGDSLSFASSQEHEYRNESNADVVALCLNWYAPLRQSASA